MIKAERDLGDIEAPAGKQSIGSLVTVIIPCAGEVDNSLVPLVGRSSPAFIPLNGQPVIVRTLTLLIRLGYQRFVIPTREYDKSLITLVTGLFGHVAEFEFPVPDLDGELGFTLLTATPHARTERALVVLGDTYFEFPEESLAKVEDDFVLIHQVSDPARWCLIEQDSDGMIQRLIDKQNTAVAAGSALIGVYGFSNWGDFRQILQEEWAKEERKGTYRMPLSVPLARYAELHKVRGIETAEWFDCGHADNLISAKKRLVQKRAFNSLTFDDVCATVVKRSEDLVKFMDEVNYYLLLPGELRIFFPRVVSSKLEPPEIELEYYGYATLSELLLFEHLDSRVWRQIFNHIKVVYERFKKFKKPAAVAHVRQMYGERIKQRVTQLANSRRELEELVGYREIYLNNERFLGFSELWPRLQQEIAELEVLEEFSVIHGDMCFSNILYDLSGRVCKFIDPRGSFGEKGIYGDPRYDIAKLLHSVHGGYDFIVNDLFSISGDSNRWELKLFAGDHLRDVEREFHSVFFPDYSARQISLIEGLLFISMGVFHFDSLKRQRAMFLTGLQILGGVVK